MTQHFYLTTFPEGDRSNPTVRIIGGPRRPLTVAAIRPVIEEFIEDNMPLGLLALSDSCVDTDVVASPDRRDSESTFREWETPSMLTPDVLGVETETAVYYSELPSMLNPMNWDFGISTRINRWWNLGRVERHVALSARNMLEGYDNPTDVVPDDAQNAQLALDDSNLPRMVVHFATMARVELPLISRDRANQLVVRAFLVRAMRLHGMRPSHIAKIIDRAVHYSFLANRYEIEANAETATREFVDRLESTNIQHWSRSRPWLFNWLGPRTVEQPYATS